jgi:cysteine desulfuration protein SufE
MDTGSSPQSSTEQIQLDLIDEFAFFDDWTDRYQYLIDLGRKLPEFPQQWRTDEYKLHGCQSQVWIHTERHGDRLHFDAISDSAIVSGLIALLLRVYSDRPAREIADTEPTFVSAIGLDAHLSPTRKNGLHAMLSAIRGHALAVLQNGTRAQA